MTQESIGFDLPIPSRPHFSHDSFTPGPAPVSRIPPFVQACWEGKRMKPCLNQGETMFNLWLSLVEPVAPCLESLGTLASAGLARQAALLAGRGGHPFFSEEPMFDAHCHHLPPFATILM